MSCSFKSDCLDGKIAVITGGGSGIGKAVTKKLMQLGCDTVIISRSLSNLREASQELEAETNRRCLPIAADVRNYEKIQETVDEVLKVFGRINILVNCAAGNFLCSLEKLTVKGFKTVMEIDAYGTFILSQTVFKKAFKYYGGVIINMSMTLHYTGALLQCHAGAAKGAIDSMTKHMAVEWGPYGVRVNGIAPGPIEGTAGVEKLVAVDKKYFTMMTKAIPLQRFGRAEEVANVTAFLSLPEASYVTGTTVVVDGGQWLTSCNYTVLVPQNMETWIKGAADAKREAKRADIPGKSSKL